MFFRTRYVVRHFGLTAVPAPLAIEKPGAPGMSLSLRLLNESELKSGFEKDDWVADLFTEESVPEDLQPRFLSPGSKPSPEAGQIAIGVSTRLHGFLNAFLQVVRWRHAVFGHHQLIRCTQGGLQWSVDSTNWQNSPWFHKATMSVENQAVPYTPDRFAEITQMLLDGDYEPVGHELLREAWNLRQSSPRSALLLGVSALEVGVKAFISAIVPDAEWMCFHVPAPPVVRILEEYLPKLPVKLTIDNEAFIPEVILKSLRHAVRQRNEVAHQGSPVPYAASLNKILMDVQMTLYFLDYYAGHSWAVNNMNGNSEVHHLLVERLKRT